MTDGRVRGSFGIWQPDVGSYAGSAFRDARTAFHEERVRLQGWKGVFHEARVTLPG
jgi:hypothetical protein